MADGGCCRTIGSCAAGSCGRTVVTSDVQAALTTAATTTRESEMRIDRHVYSSLRISGFQDSQGAEVERKMGRAWLIVGNGSVDIGLRCSVIANQFSLYVCVEASGQQ
jgi:hypothetical protein